MLWLYYLKVTKPRTLKHWIWISYQWRVFGVKWCITFKFKIIIKDKLLTRRRIISTVSTIYDTLGILSPVMLLAKKKS